MLQSERVYAFARACPYTGPSEQCMEVIRERRIRRVREMTAPFQSCYGVIINRGFHVLD